MNGSAIKTLLPPGALLPATAVALALGLLVTGCGDVAGTRHSNEAFAKLSDTRKFHAIEVVAETSTVALALLPNGSGLAPNAYFDAERFARRYRQDGKGPLVIGVPPQAKHNRAVAESVSAVRRLVARAGISGHSVKYAGSHAHDGVSAITLSYDRIAAIPPKCGNWSENTLRNRERLPSPNFGCATQHNLAVMVANPKDLLYPTQETPRPSERRAAAFKEYAKPEPKTDLTLKMK